MTLENQWFIEILSIISKFAFLGKKIVIICIFKAKCFILDLIFAIR